MNKLNRMATYPTTTNNNTKTILRSQWNAQSTKQNKLGKQPSLYSIIYKRYPKQTKIALASLVLITIYFTGLGNAVDGVMQVANLAQTSTSQSQAHSQNQSQTQTTNKTTQANNQTPHKTLIAKSAAKPSQTAINKPIDPNITNINQYFKQKFRGGDWYYQGIEAIDEKLKVYIQIPKQMRLSGYETSNYIQLALCPSQHQSKTFKTLKNNQLEIHLYSTLKSQSVSALCKV
ncbi:hypothetical protein [Algibacillus agarilyticus]|uniref:hypothetical protein n=1 Tax=Algibacillus agarilyticus TaxID=2234133 RepID=UPI000DD0C61A|nr:hypothetical protein [Algibacillus agarilyticus]